MAGMTRRTPGRLTRAQVHALFSRERAEFDSVLGRFFPDRHLPRLFIVDRECTLPGACAERDLAYAEHGDRPQVVLLARALKLPRNNIVGLIRHELGHLYDKRVRSRGAEQRADNIAAYVTGELIKYDRRDIQTIGRGVYPRPRRLHR